MPLPPLPPVTRRNLMLVDIETTSQNPADGAICEATILIKDRASPHPEIFAARFEEALEPGVVITDEATAVNGFDLFEWADPEQSGKLIDYRGFFSLLFAAGLGGGAQFAAWNKTYELTWLWAMASRHIDDDDSSKVLRLGYRSLDVADLTIEHQHSVVGWPQSPSLGPTAEFLGLDAGEEAARLKERFMGTPPSGVTNWKSFRDVALEYAILQRVAPYRL